MDALLRTVGVDKYFGGSGRAAKIEGREFTATESRIVDVVRKGLLADLKEAWAPVVAMEPEHFATEANPQFVVVAGLDGQRQLVAQVLGERFEQGLGYGAARHEVGDDKFDGHLAWIQQQTTLFAKLGESDYIAVNAVKS